MKKGKAGEIKHFLAMGELVEEGDVLPSYRLKPVSDLTLVGYSPDEEWDHDEKFFHNLCIAEDEIIRFRSICKNDLDHPVDKETWHKLVEFLSVLKKEDERINNYGLPTSDSYVLSRLDVEYGWSGFTTILGVSTSVEKCLEQIPIECEKTHLELYQGVVYDDSQRVTPNMSDDKSYCLDTFYGRFIITPVSSLGV